MSILESVAGSNVPASAAEVAEATGLSLSTVSRLMLQFAESGLLHRNERDRRYTLGPRLYSLARSADAQMDVVEIARPLLERIRDATGETASMHVLRGNQRVCVASVPSHESVRRVVPVGLSEPVRGSATGAALLAGCSLDERRAALAGLGLSKKDERELDALIEHVREHGWAIVKDRWVSGITGLSAAVSGAGAFAAISASGPSSRFTQEKALEHVDDVLAAAQAISARLGHNGR